MLIKFSSIYYLITGQTLPKFVAIFYLDVTCLKEKLCPNLTIQNILKWDYGNDNVFVAYFEWTYWVFLWAKLQFTKRCQYLSPLKRFLWLRHRYYYCVGYFLVIMRLYCWCFCLFFVFWIDSFSYVMQFCEFDIVLAVFLMQRKFAAFWHGSVVFWIVSKIC